MLIRIHVQVGYFHAFVDGVDYVFVDHPCFHGRGKNIYGGERQEILFRCALLCKVRSAGSRGMGAWEGDGAVGGSGAAWEGACLGEGSGL